MKVILLAAAAAAIRFIDEADDMLASEGNVPHFKDSWEQEQETLAQGIDPETLQPPQ